MNLQNKDDIVVRILCIGDIVGRPGRDVLVKLLPGLKEQHRIDVVIANGENSAGGSGITPKQSKEIFAAGVDVITLGDHVWDRPEVNELLATQEQVIRPANFPAGAPGKGMVVFSTANGIKIAVINLLGRSFMRYHVDCPFRVLDGLLLSLKDVTPIVVLDMHAETTSEKVAMGHYADGRASIVFGTHTHIQTADEKILPQGTAYITDLGMSGPYDSVIGQTKEKIIARFLTSIPQKFEVAEGEATLHGIIVEVDETTGKALSIKRVQEK